MRVGAANGAVSRRKPPKQRGASVCLQLGEVQQLHGDDQHDNARRPAAIPWEKLTTSRETGRGRCFVRETANGHASVADAEMFEHFALAPEPVPVRPAPADDTRDVAAEDCPLETIKYVGENVPIPSRNGNVDFSLHKRDVAPEGCPACKETSVTSPVLLHIESCPVRQRVDAALSAFHREHADPSRRPA